MPPSLGDLFGEADTVRLLAEALELTPDQYVSFQQASAAAATTQQPLSVKGSRGSLKLLVEVDWKPPFRQDG
jgi:hypothetical protein